MVYGMPTLMELENAEECAALCRELGLDFVELNMNFPEYQLPRLCCDKLLALKEKYGIFFTIHLEENLNPAEFNPYVAEAYTRTALETIALARRIGAPIINMHLARGIFITLPEGKPYLYEKYLDFYLASMRAFCESCTEAIGGSYIRLCLENSAGFTPFQLAAIDLLLESPAFALTFDIGHDHAIGETDMIEILRRAERLRHCHFHDAIGTKNHLALGAGEIDLPSRFAFAREHGATIVLETKTVAGLRESVKWKDSHGY